MCGILNKTDVNFSYAEMKTAFMSGYERCWRSRELPLREQLKAAEDFITIASPRDENWVEYHEALEKYQQLKEKI